jgi:probable blue pigment (indigoidine) exporter
MNRSRALNLAGFLLVSVLWGASYPAIRVALAGFDPLFLAATRFDLTGLLVLAVAVAGASGASGEAARWRPTRRDWPSVLAAGLLLVGVHNGLLFLGQARVPSAVASAVVGTVPILSTGVARVALPSDRLTATGVLGVLLGLGGVVVIADPSPDGLESASNVGVLLLFCSAFVFAVASVAIRRFRTDLGVAGFQGWAMLMGGVALHGFSLAVGESQTATLSPRVLAGFGFLVVAAGVVGYLCYFALLDRLGPVEINLVAYVETVFAALVGWLVLSEGLAGTTVWGFGLVFAGFLLVKRDAIREEVVRWRGD